MKTLTDCDQYPWLFQNLRNTNLIRRMIEDIDDNSREELISLLFLVTHALIRQDSGPLAERYIGVIIARVDFTLCASALAAIIPSLQRDGLSEIMDLLVVARAQFLASWAGSYSSEDMSDFPQQFTKYGRLLEASESSDPKIAAILLLLSKGMHIQAFGQTLRNVATSHDTPNGNSMNIRSCHDHRIHNMFGALSLLLCPHGATIYDIHGQFPFLSSFLEASDPAISCPVLYHYMGLFGSITPPQSYDFFGALHNVFNPVLPSHDLPRGWVFLDRFLHKFDDYPAPLRKTFAEAFFSQSCRPLLKGSRQKGTPGSIQKISNILTWEYFCKEDPKHEMSDAEFSGLDWMAMAWSLHLSQPSGTKVTISTQEEKGPQSHEERWLSEQFVLQVLCRLLEAAQYHSVIPIIPRFHEFVEWFDDSEHSEYKSAISARLEGAVRDEWKMLYNFENFHCMWSI